MQVRQAVSAEIAEMTDVSVATAAAKSSKMECVKKSSKIRFSVKLTGKNPGAIGPPGKPSFAGN